MTRITFRGQCVSIWVQMGPFASRGSSFRILEAEPNNKPLTDRDAVSEILGKESRREKSRITIDFLDFCHEGEI